MRHKTADRHLITRGEIIWYWRGVPADVQALLGKRLIAQSLDTTDSRVARAARDTLDAQWDLAIKRARSGNRIGAEDVEQEAGRAYDGWLMMLAQLDDPMLTRVFMEGHQEAIEQRRWGDAERAVADIERRTGFVVPRDSPEYASLSAAILRAQIAAATGYLKAREGEPSDKPLYFTPQAIDLTTLQPIARRKPAKGDSFLKVCERYLAERNREALSESSRRRMQIAFRLFSDFSGDLPLAGVDRAMAANFLDTVAKLHPKWGQRPGSQELPLAELLKRFPGQLSNATLNHYASALKTLFDWARKRGAIKGENPFSEQSRKAGDAGWEPYSPKELKTLLSGLSGQMGEIVLMALYSGMRQGEILQLTGADVKTEAGVQFFDLGKEHQLKTKSAVRRVPVHSKLDALGLHKRKGLLWPGSEDSAYFSKRFTLARRKLGLDRPRSSFHSLRGNFVTALDQAGVHQADIAALVGHARWFTFDHYSGGAGLKRLREIVEKVKYAAGS
jgi:integrase